MSAARSLQDSPSSPPLVGYVLSNFPALSQTFVLNEILELETQGVALHVFSLRRPTGNLVHEEFTRLKAQVTYLPGAARLLGLLRYHRQLARELGGAYLRQFIVAASRGPQDLWRFTQAAFIAAEAKRLGLAHLHVHFAHHPTTVAMYASLLSGIPFSFTAHAMDLFRRRVNRRSLGRKLAAARFVVTVSDFNLAFLRTLAPDQQEKLVLNRYGIALDRFTPSPTPAGPFRILCVARLVEKKGVALLIAACGILRDRGLLFQCEVIGEGVLRPRLEALIQQSGLGDVVHLVGPATQAEVRNRYRLAHVFVLPCVVAADGDRDGLPVALLEAMACGLSVVTTPVTGIPEVVRDRENGLLVPPGDETALADAIALLMADASLARRLGASARPAVAAAFDRRHTVAALRAHFPSAGA